MSQCRPEAMSSEHGSGSWPCLCCHLLDSRYFYSSQTHLVSYSKGVYVMITEKSLQCDLFALSWQNQHRYIQMKKRRDQIRSTNQKFLQISLKIEIEIVPYRCIHSFAVVIEILVRSLRCVKNVSGTHVCPTHT